MVELQFGAVVAHRDPDLHAQARRLGQTPLEARQPRAVLHRVVGQHRRAHHRRLLQRRLDGPVARRVRRHLRRRTPIRFSGSNSAPLPPNDPHGVTTHHMGQSFLPDRPSITPERTLLGSRPTRWGHDPPVGVTTHQLGNALGIYFSHCPEPINYPSTTPIGVVTHQLGNPHQLLYRRPSFLSLPKSDRPSITPERPPMGS